MRRWGDWWWRADAVARKKPGGRLRGRCDSLVVETDVHYPTDLFTVGWGAVSIGRRPSGGGTRGGRLAATPASGQAGEVGVQCALGTARQATPVKVERKSCRIWSSGPKGPSHFGKGVGEAECRLIRGYIDHARRQIDQPAAAGRADSSPGEGVLHLRAAHALDLEGQGGPPVELGVGWDRGSMFAAITSCLEGRRRGGRGAGPSAVRHELRGERRASVGSSWLVKQFAPATGRTRIAA